MTTVFAQRVDVHSHACILVAKSREMCRPHACTHACVWWQRVHAHPDRRVDVIINERTSGSALNLFDIHATYNRQTLSCTFPSPSPPSPAFQLYPTSTTRHFVIVIPGSPSTSEKSGESSVKSMHPRYGNSLTGIYRRCALRGQTRSTRLQRHQGVMIAT